MKLTFIGKYPPIIGGESTKLYWLAKKLGERGHKCSIISDCQERTDKANLILDDLKYLQPTNVDLYSGSVTNIFPEEKQFKTERLANLAIKVVGNRGSDLIIGWYLLPYGTAASIVAKHTGKGYVLQHAGSDMKKFFSSPNLKTLLLNQFNDSIGVMVYPSYFPSFNNKRENVFLHNPKIDKKGFENCPDFEMPKKLEGKKIITFLGKVNEPKGALDLFNAYNQLGESNEYALLYVGNGKIKDRIQQLALENQLKNISFIPPVPTWRVPGILRASNIFFLGERNFYVQTHFSSKGMEAMLCHTPLIISPEMKNKGAYLRIADGEHCVEVDPRDTYQLVGKLKHILNDDNFAEKIANNGYEFACQANQGFDLYIDSVENYLKHVASIK